MTKKTFKARTKPTEQASMFLGPFLEFAEEGEVRLARYLLHCGIDDRDIQDLAARKPPSWRTIASRTAPLTLMPPLMISSLAANCGAHQRAEADSIARIRFG